jgi:hypothetical protein
VADAEPGPMRVGLRLDLGGHHGVHPGEAGGRGGGSGVAAREGYA